MAPTSRIFHSELVCRNNLNVPDELADQLMALARLTGLVGTGRFELPTCRLGGDRSIQLSYVPAPELL